MITQEETQTSSTDPKLPKSRFFRTRRKQRGNQNSADEENKSIEKTKTRSRSPPPTIVITDDSDIENGDNNDDDDNNGNDEDIPDSNFAQHRSSNPLYQRAKSHSVKLTRHHEDVFSSPKKAVRFADDFGLNLSQMKVINTDELPFVPTEAFKHLQINASNHTNSLASQERFKLVTYMEPLFENPLYTPGFMERVFQEKIVLEQANAIDNRIYGTIRLVSLGLHKQVQIRLTTDNWITYRDYPATYISNSYDGTCDRFTFTIDIDRDRLCTGNNIQFSICYESFVGSTFWDNNYDRNYRFNCHSRTIPDYSL